MAVLLASPEVWAADWWNRDLQDSRPVLPRELGLSFRGSAADSIEAYWVCLIPVRPSRFPAGPFGFSRSAVAPLVFRRAGNSSLRVTCLLEATSNRQPHPDAQSRCTSHEVLRPYSAPQKQVPVCPGDFPHRRHRPSSAFRTPSTAYFTCNPARLVSSALRSWGSTESAHSLQPFGQCRAITHPGSLSKAFSSPVTNGSSPLSSRASFRMPTGQGGRSMDPAR